MSEAYARAKEKAEVKNLTGKQIIEMLYMHTTTEGDQIAELVYIGKLEEAQNGLDLIKAIDKVIEALPSIITISEIKMEELAVPEEDRPNAGLKDRLL